MRLGHLVKVNINFFRFHLISDICSFNNFAHCSRLFSYFIIICIIDRHLSLDLL